MQLLNRIPDPDPTGDDPIHAATPKNPPHHHPFHHPYSILRNPPQPNIPIPNTLTNMPPPHRNPLHLLQRLPPSPRPIPFQARKLPPLRSLPHQRSAWRNPFHRMSLHTKIGHMYAVA